MLGMKRHFGAHLQCWCLFTRKTCASFLQTYMHFRVTYKAYFFEKSGNQPTEKILHCWRKYVCRINSKPANNPTKNWNLIALRSYNTRFKSWNICVRFPFSNVDLCIAVIWELQNTRGSTLGEERSTFQSFQREQRCEEQMSEFFQKTQVKRCLFQQFVTGIVGSRICWHWCADKTESNVYWKHIAFSSILWTICLVTQVRGCVKFRHQVHACVKFCHPNILLSDMINLINHILKLLF